MPISSRQQRRLLRQRATSFWETSHKMVLRPEELSDEDEYNHKLESSEEDSRDFARCSSTIRTHHGVVSKKPLTAVPSRKQQPLKHVSFGTVQIRCHELVVGDHPYCATGCPLSLGWQYSDDAVPCTTLDEYEARRCGQRRSMHEFRTTCQERHARLLEQTTTSAPEAVVVSELRHACRVQQRHRDRRIRQAEQMAFFSQSS
ncbi:hypothetical protein ACA910_004748 [Epithemia clementina (nom. ined.)]